MPSSAARSRTAKPSRSRRSGASARRCRCASAAPRASSSCSCDEQRRALDVSKGGRERGETLAQAAAREAREEAGASGRIREQPIAAYFLGNDIVTAFLLEVDATRRPAESGRKPTWFQFDAARAKLAEGREFLFDERMQRVLIAAERAWRDARRGPPPA